MRKNITLKKYKENFREYEIPKELEELFLFQFGEKNDLFIYPFYMDFVLEDDFTWFSGDEEKDKLLLNSIIAFADSDGSGGVFAFWLQDNNKDLSNTPIIHIDSEGGSHLECKNIKDLLIIMTGDLDHGIVNPDGVGPSDYINEYRVWVKNTFDIDTVDIKNTDDYESPPEVKKIYEDVAKKYLEAYNRWKLLFFHDY